MDNNQPDKKRGSKGYRFLMTALYVLLGLLFYWFLGFLMNDISNQPGPNLTKVQKQFQDPAFVKEIDDYSKAQKKLFNSIEEKRQQQTILQTSITSYRDTMNQLLDLQKASIQKGVTFSPESQANLQNVTTLYLDYQKQFQTLNESITKDNLEVQQFQNKITAVNVGLTKQNEKAQTEFERLWVRHNWAMAGLQLVLLIPLLLITAFLYRKYKTSLYGSMILTAGIAVFVKIASVMHWYFPSTLFNYLLLLALIFITIRILLSMLTMIKSPKPEWLQKQYKEAYQKSQCPSCQFSIKPGISKFFFPEIKGNVSVADYSYLKDVEAYTCPSCGETLFEKCTYCSHTRHSLLDYCDHCGVKKEFTITQDPN